jgi:hypothetical protein
MASIVYNSFLSDVFAGNCNTTHTYKALLTTSAYSENRATHTKRSDITNEVTGAGYTAGGIVIVPTFAVSNANNLGTLTIPSVSWTGITTTARKLIVYRSRGGAASADELVCCVDNGEDLIVTSGTLSISFIRWEIPLPPPV